MVSFTLCTWNIMTITIIKPDQSKKETVPLGVDKQLNFCFPSKFTFSWNLLQVSFPASIKQRHRPKSQLLSQNVKKENKRKKTVTHQQIKSFHILWKPVFSFRFWLLPNKYAIIPSYKMVISHYSSGQSNELQLF